MNHFFKVSHAPSLKVSRSRVVPCTEAHPVSTVLPSRYPSTFDNSSSPCKHHGFVAAELSHLATNLRKGSRRIPQALTEITFFGVQPPSPVPQRRWICACARSARSKLLWGTRIDSFPKVWCLFHCRRVLMTLACCFWAWIRSIVIADDLVFCLFFG